MAWEEELVNHLPTFGVLLRLPYGFARASKPLWARIAVRYCSLLNARNRLK